MKLHDALRHFVEGRRRGPYTLVLEAYAEDLTDELTSLVHPRSVAFHDYRAAVPTGFAEELEEGLEEGKLIHLALDRSVDGRLVEALLDLSDTQWNLHERATWRDGEELTHEEIWNRLEAAARPGTIVISTPAPSPDDIHISGDVKATEYVGEVGYRGGMNWTAAKDKGGLLWIAPNMVRGGEHESPWRPAPWTQAIVLVHGIGRQRPKDTLRRFVSAVVGEGAPEARSERDESSHEDIRGELRRFVHKKRDHVGSYGRVIEAPRNVFFEYYWADALKQTTLDHVQGWFLRLLSHPPPRHLLPLWTLTWFLVFGSLGALASGAWNLVTAVRDALPPLVASLAFFLALMVYRRFLLETVGDAARYLEPDPDNIAIRKAVRERGMHLLRNLVLDASYDRIVVVGHSLGSVIAYDVLRALWEEDVFPKRTALPSSDEASSVTGPTEEADHDASVFQEGQLRLQFMAKKSGFPRWPITDLVTIGSPLAHAPTLVADFERRRAELELPMCPPHRGPLHGAATSAAVVDDSDGRRGALFALTRWTNIYAEAHLGLFGDFLAGQVRPYFGWGVKDWSVTTGGLLRSWSPLAHVSYWRVERRQRRVGQVREQWCTRSQGPPSDRGVPHRGLDRSLSAITYALDLSAERLGIPGRRPSEGRGGWTFAGSGLPKRRL